ncbi:MAG: hypothetical protein BGP13_22710 [Sphingobacteriales bacterium 40-81]|nr:MAG: hypothetical protein BGP13_22710 [Sphingobacteriales bacterium 40-81]
MGYKLQPVGITQRCVKRAVVGICFAFIHRSAKVSGGGGDTDVGIGVTPVSYRGSGFYGLFGKLLAAGAVYIANSAFICGNGFGQLNGIIVSY